MHHSEIPLSRKKAVLVRLSDSKHFRSSYAIRGKLLTTNSLSALHNKVTARHADRVNNKTIDDDDVCCAIRFIDN